MYSCSRVYIFMKNLILGRFVGMSENFFGELASKYALFCLPMVLMGLLSACGGDTQLTENESLKRAAIFARQGDINSAIIEYKSALQLNPLNADARWQLGKLYLNGRQPHLAEKELQKSISLGANYPRLRVNLVESMLALGEYHKALDVLDAGEFSGSNVETEALILKGKALVGLYRIDEAEASFQHALDIQPENIEATLGLASTAMRNFNLVQAGALVDQVLMEFPENTDALMLEGDLYKLGNNLRAAIATYTKVIELDPRHVIAQLSRAQAFLEEGKVEAALLDVDLLEKKVPGYPMIGYLRALVAYQQQDYPAVEEYLAHVLLKVPKHLKSLLLLATVQYEDERYEAASATLDEYLAADPGNVDAGKLKAKVLIDRGNAEDAIDLLEGMAYVNGGDQQISLLLGAAYIKAGMVEKATDIFARVAEKMPDNAGVRARLGILQMVSSDRRESVDQMEAAVNLGADNPGMNIIIAMKYIADGDLDSADKAVSKVLEMDPELPLGFYLKGVIAQSRKNLDAAKRFYEQALSLKYDFLPAVLELGRLEEQGGKVGAVVQRLEALREKDPFNQAVLRKLALLAEKDRAYHRAIIFWKALVDLDANNLSSVVALANNYLRIRDPRRALAIATDAASRFDESPQVVELIGVAQLRLKAFSDAGESFEKLVKMLPEVSVPYYRLAQVEAATGDITSANHNLEKALSIEPNYFKALTLFAYINKVDGNTEKALEAAVRLKDAFPQRADGLLFEGDIYAAQGDYVKSINAYQDAYQLQPDRYVMGKLYDSYKISGDREHGIKLLEKWLEKVPGDTEVRLILGGAYVEAKRVADAEKQYLAVLEEHPDELPALVNIAWLLLGNSDGRAVSFAERAYNLDKNAAIPADALGWALVKTGRAEEALPVLKKALLAAPHLASIRYHLSAALHDLGHDAEAIDALNRILDDEGEFVGRADAIRLRDKLVHTDTVSVP